MRIDRQIERLIYVMRDGIESAGEPRNFVVRIERIGIERISNAKRPCQLARHLPSVLRIQVEIQKIERLVGRSRKRLARRGRRSIDILGERRVGHRRNRALAKIVIVEP